MPPDKDRRVAELDGLRGVAILLVLWHHSVEWYLPLNSAHLVGWLRAGSCLSWSGVDLFFVLSGYFIGGILIDQRESPRLIRTFYVRRAFRILPLFYFTLAILLVAAAAHLMDATQLSPSWVYGLFLSNFTMAWLNTWDWAPLSVLWSLAVEEQFYLTAPWLVRWIPTRRLPLLLLCLIAGAWLLRISIHLTQPGNTLAPRVLMPARMDTLALGALLAWAVRTESAGPFIRRLTDTWKWWSVASVALVFLAAVNYFLGIDYVTNCYGYSVLAFSYALLVAVVAVVRPPWLVSLLSSPLPTSFGRYSFFIYLWHIPISSLVVRWLWGRNEFILQSQASYAIMLSGLAATWLAGMASWKIFESPLLRLGHRSRY